MIEHTTTAVTALDVDAAAERLRPWVRRTPVIEVDGPSLGLASDVTLKLELCQHAGSFKARGAFNNLLGVSVPGAGVVTASGGNHGAAVAFAARRLGVPARVYVPAIASPAKIARIESYGATVVVGGAAYAEAYAASEQWAAAYGALAIHAYDAPATLAGQGTVAREFAEQAAGLDTVLVAVGGGGLIGGMAAWYRDAVKLVAVEPERAQALRAALAAGRPVDVEVSGIAADSLGARRVGELMFPIAQAWVDEALTVEEAAIRAAQRRLWEVARIAAEPGGAAALAALLSGAYRPRSGERVGVLVCGGNLDPATLG